MFANILIGYETKNLDKSFTYIIPSSMKKRIKVGMKVEVPFNNKTINGFVLSINNKYEDTYKLKEIKKIVDEKIILNKEQLELGQFIKEKTLCSLMTAYETMLPSGLKIQSTNKYDLYDNYLILCASVSEIKDYINRNSRYSSQIFILEELLSNNEILKKDCSLSSANTLIKKGLIKEIKKKKYRLNRDIDYELNDIKLSSDQINVINAISRTLSSNDTYLIHGVTGSGKTLVYINLIKEVLKMNKTAIVLVPEISLTTQIVNIFYDYFGDAVAILHSGLSIGERYDEYVKILNNKIKVVIGTRSAIFAPLENIGIIIMDEEHSLNYKQDNNPRYHARDIALWRSRYNSCPLVLGSATPSLESMARALKGVYNYLVMPKRINNSILPKIYLVDMIEEMRQRNPILSSLLISKIKERLDKKEQVILLLNRRGFSTYINCSACGYIYKCPHCDISLTYHKTTNNLRCHYCGYTVFKSDNCPNCHENALNYYGLGTEKLETELKNIFPKSQIIRMDADTTANKGSHARIINDFAQGKYDILLGTQMIAKGLDFKKVSLVGIICADNSLNIPDYRSGENTFSLLSQASGRAGRSNILGEVIIQTFNPENYTLNCVKDNNYMKYYQYEMNIRKKLLYPPYVYLASLKVVSSNYELCSKEASKISKYLKENLVNNEILLGPTTASMFKIGNKYRFQLVIKYKDESKLLEVLKELDKIFIMNGKVSLEIDLNPSRI